MGPYINKWYFELHSSNPLSIIGFVVSRSLYWNINIEMQSYLVYIYIQIIQIPQNPQSRRSTIKNLNLIPAIISHSDLIIY